MSFFNRNSRNLTIEQQRLLSMNISQYEQINTHIDLLFNMLDEIRGNIINITQSNNIGLLRNNDRTSRQINRIFNNRYNFINYDYERPISLYYGTNTNTNTNTLSSLFSNFLNTTVPVRPTDEQIQSATRLIRYGDIGNPLAEYCPISLEDFNEDDQVRQIIHCGHIFHHTEFQRWFETNTRCPICRYDIRNYSQRTNANSNANTNTNENTNANVNENTNTNENNQMSSRTPVSNISLLRDTSLNQIEQLSFDITDTQFTNSFLDQIARNIILQSLTSSINDDDIFMIDPSNNILLYETILRPSRRRNQNNNNVNQYRD